MCAEKYYYKITLRHRLLYLYFLLFIFLWTYQEGIYRDKVFSIPGHAFLLFTVVSLLIINLKNKYVPKLDKKCIACFIIFNVWSSLLAVFEGEFLSAYVTGGGQILLFLCFYNFVIFYNLKKTEYVVHFINMLIILSVVSVMVALYVFAFGGFSLGMIKIQQPSFGGGGRLTGWYGSPNNLAPVFAVAIIATLFKLSRQQYFLLSKKWSIVYSIIIFINFIGLILTGSRGTWVAFAIGLMLFLILNFSKIISKPKNTIKILLSILSLSISTIILLSYIGYDLGSFMQQFVRPDKITAQLDFYNRGWGRAYYWRESFELMRTADISTALFGYGLSGFMEIVNRSSHSGFLTVAVDRGLIALLLFLMLIYYLFKDSILNLKQSSIKFFSICLLTFLMIKNTTTVDIPWNTFPGIVFVMTLLLISMKDDSPRLKR
ncbi:membrane hypothetical protein [uncultured Desulfatiglans sp.]|nr:membrane hypothetical protein [uncultured Desulfatiglans sp.]